MHTWFVPTHLFTILDSVLPLCVGVVRLVGSVDWSMCPCLGFRARILVRLASDRHTSLPPYMPFLSRRMRSLYYLSKHHHLPPLSIPNRIGACPCAIYAFVDHFLSPPLSCMSCPWTRAIPCTTSFFSFSLHFAHSRAFIVCPHCGRFSYRLSD